MRAVIFFLLPVLSGVFAQDTATCVCPAVRCRATNRATLCNCLNAREKMCHERCPAYEPTYRLCPTPHPSPPLSLSLPPRPTSQTPTGTSTQNATCTCAPTFCAMVWPQSCYCRNAAKKRCWEKCGGEAPAYNSCPPMSKPTLLTMTMTSEAPAPTPRPTNPVCGGGRAGYRGCEEGFACIKEPDTVGCGPECDGLGICVRERMCGGFAGVECETRGMVCVDDPRDDCDPMKGGADCGGLCMWPTDGGQ